MKTFDKIMAAMQLFMRYAPYAVAGALAVEAAVGQGNGQTKKQAVVAGILAGAHAGETVPIAQVQAISGVVEMVVGTLNASGLLGKPPADVVVPPAA